MLKNSTKLNVIGLSKETLSNIFEASGKPKYRTTQLLQHIYQTPRAISFDQCYTFSKDERIQLKEELLFDRGNILNELKSKDGTIKWLFSLPYPQEKMSVETVYIPREDDEHEIDIQNVNFNQKEKKKVQDIQYSSQRGGTLCISSQIGCSLSCTFCHTGTQTLQGNIHTTGIVSQYLLASDQLLTYNLGNIRNIVFMGQGEPLLNFRNVKNAIDILIQYGNISPRRITISTSGVAPLITRLPEELPNGVRLAVSLHAANNTLRDQLMNINKQWPLAILMKACQEYIQKRTQYISTTSRKNQATNRITFEYVLLDGINDSNIDAENLSDLLLSYIPKQNIHINLLPFHPWPGSIYKNSTRMDIFSNILRKNNLHFHIRKSRGLDILAACGQLHSQEGQSFSSI